MPIHRFVPLLLILLVTLSACATYVPGGGSEARHWADARQLVLVTTPDWGSAGGELRRFERNGSAWREVGAAVPIAVGRTGLAWGLGLNAPRTDGPVKREGDGKAPAGVYAIGPAFGYAATARTGLDYQAMSANDWCIDVPESRYYNRIVDRSVVTSSGVEKSTEPMRLDIHGKNGDQRYREGFVIQHNAAAKPSAGSCIFAHLWGSPGQATAGCTAMAPESMQPLLAWLDRSRKPVFVQLPQAHYARLRGAWDLPDISVTEGAR